MAVPRHLLSDPLALGFIVPVRDLVLELGDRHRVFVEVEIEFRAPGRRHARYRFRPHTGRIFAVGGGGAPRSDDQFVRELAALGHDRFTVRVAACDTHRRGPSTVRRLIRGHPAHRWFRGLPGYRRPRALLPPVAPPPEPRTAAPPSGWWCPVPRTSTADAPDRMPWWFSCPSAPTRPSSVAWLHAALSGSVWTPSAVDPRHAVCLLQRNAVGLCLWARLSPLPVRVPPPPIPCRCACDHQPPHRAWSHADVLEDWPLLCSILGQEHGPFSTTATVQWVTGAALDILTEIPRRAPPLRRWLLRLAAALH